MADNYTKRPSITSFFRTVNIFPFFTLILLIAGVSAFAAVYVSTGNMLFFYLMIGYSIMMVVFYLLGIFYFSRKFNALFVRGLYSISSRPSKWPSGRSRTASPSRASPPPAPSRT